MTWSSDKGRLHKHYLSFFWKCWDLSLLVWIQITLLDKKNKKQKPVPFKQDCYIDLARNSKQINSEIKAFLNEQIWADQSFLSHSHTKTKSCNFPPERKTPNILLEAVSELKGEAWIEILCNINNRNERAKPCVGACATTLNFDFVKSNTPDECPCENIISQRLHYPSLYHYPVSTLWGRAESN